MYLIVFENNTKGSSETDLGLCLMHFGIAPLNVFV